MLCEICGKDVNIDEGRETEDGFVCDDCIAEYYKRCPVCEDEYIKNDKPRCDVCENNIYSNSINNYNTKPVPVFKNSSGLPDGKDIGCRYYGLEMEFNYTDACDLQSYIPELYRDKYLYNKRDGSIDEGVEVVTSPLSKKAVKYVLKTMSKNGAFDFINENDFEDNAGLHIHVNLTTIDPIDRYKLHMLLNNRVNDMEKQSMFYLSNRTDELDYLGNYGYCTIGCTDTIDYKKSKSNIDRRIALNIKNSHTFEFRIFKSSTSPRVILSYIEIVDTMIDFCHTHGFKDINISTYLSWLYCNTKNDIILRKLKEINSKFNLKPRENMISYNKAYDIIKELKWYEYYKVLNYLEHADDNRKTVCARVMKFKEDYDNGTLDRKLEMYNINSANCKLAKELKDKIKEHLINKIISEVEKCA